MKSNNTNSNDNSTEQAKEGRCLQLSAKLDQAIANLLTLPEFREIIDELGKSAATMVAIKTLRKTRPALFDSQNPGDGLASLYAAMD